MARLGVGTITDNAGNATNSIIPMIRGTGKAWASFNIQTPGISNSLNMTSLIDLGTGLPEFAMTNPLAAATGSAQLEPAIYSNGTVRAAQCGVLIVSTITSRGQCGSDFSFIFDDWQRGSVSITGDFA